MVKIDACHVSDACSTQVYPTNNCYEIIMFYYNECGWVEKWRTNNILAFPHRAGWWCSYLSFLKYRSKKYAIATKIL